MVDLTGVNRMKFSSLLPKHVYKSETYAWKVKLCVVWGRELSDLLFLEEGCVLGCVCHSVHPKSDDHVHEG
jgi:hypothetical protein